jgi:hypothetical protein
MKKLLIAAAAVAVLPAFLAQAQAAKQDPMCKLNGGVPSWQEHYGCWPKPMGMMAPAPAPMMHHHHHHHKA